MAKYMWVKHLQKGKIHLVKWNLITRTVTEGGWGIQDLNNFNRSLLIKNIWRAMGGNNIWAQIIRGKYMKGEHFSNWMRTRARHPSGSSQIWSNMMKTLPWLVGFLKWEFGI